MLSFSPESRTRVTRVTNASGRGPQINAEEAAELERARDRMIARYRLIEGIIRNNEMQLKNESARGGVEIELECAKRELARAGSTEALAELARVTERLQALRDEHQRLVIERQWLNTSLLEFDSNPSANESQRSGNA
jgi:hypothetical protein